MISMITYIIHNHIPSDAELVIQQIQNIYSRFVHVTLQKRVKRGKVLAFQAKTDYNNLMIIGYLHQVS